ncbi:hypothetical protein DAI22_11g033201 [Oryza sativa Japonica Group]|nr:hypothetical protein DAI22_11g033201 [Oryza sativa Japonica Group]
MKQERIPIFINWIRSTPASHLTLSLVVYYYGLVGGWPNSVVAFTIYYALLSRYATYRLMIWRHCNVYMLDFSGSDHTVPVI